MCRGVDNLIIAIREATNNDIEALIRCHARFMDHHTAVDKRFSLKPGAEDKWSEQISEAVNNTDSLVLVADDKGFIAGCAYVIIKAGAPDFGHDETGYLCDVYVYPDYRRKGIARSFLTAAKKWLIEKDIHTIEANWSVYSSEAQKTWSALGFNPFSTTGQLEF
jgi:ribosomal protein S18 acetylase RimI-like enzyme